MARSRGERLERLVSHMRVEGSSRIEHLASVFNVSTATIRRDVKELERQGVLLQTVGGGIHYGGGGGLHTYEPVAQTAAQLEEKIRIGRYVSRLVQAEDEILIGPGSTTLIAGKSLADIDDREFRVITNSIELALVTSRKPNIRSVLIGGEVSGTGTTGFDGPSDFFAHCHREHKLFLSCDGVDIERGVTAFDTAYLGLVRKMVDVSRDITLLVDSSKLATSRFNRIMPVSRVTRLVTDCKAKHEICEQLRSVGIEVVTV